MEGAGIYIYIYIGNLLLTWSESSLFIHFWNPPFGPRAGGDKQKLVQCGGSSSGDMSLGAAVH